MSHTVSVTLTDDEYEEALQKSREIGLDISQYVKRYNIGDNEFDRRYKHLIATANIQPEGIPFTVMALFPDWNTIPKGVKLSLGRNFYHLVKRNDNAVANILPAGKNSSNVQLYVLGEKKL